MSDNDVHGPIDFVLLEFPGDRPTGDVAAELQALIQQGAVRLYDLVIVRKAADGSVSSVVLDEADLDALGGFGAFAGARSGLLGDEDQELAASAMEPNTTAVLLVYENAWAIPFVAAARRAGGEMIATARIPAQDVMDTIAALEAAG